MSDMTEPTRPPAVAPAPGITSPLVMVIFGVTGDLARNKLLPALLSLFNHGELPSEFAIVGFSRRNLTDDELRGSFDGLKSAPGWADFSRHMVYQQGVFEAESGYLSLVKKLNAFDAMLGTCATRLFYLATPPSNYQTILGFLGRTELANGCGQGSNQWTRVIVEKPFGSDLETAREIDKTCSLIFEEKQIFRVDHYLGKESVQNMLAFRFANGIFEPVWNSKYIDHVQITWAETKGIEDRGKFFDDIGLLRDIAQNHLVQLIAAVAMEPPKSFVNEAIRDARTSAIASIRLMEPEDVPNHVVRGQYEGYLAEKNVAADSHTETFVAMQLFVDTPRFHGVPFFIRAGKMMPRNMVEISVVFVQTCHILFKEYGCPELGNVLTIRIQPDEGIWMRFNAKTPGVNIALAPVTMKFSYREQFGGEMRDAYEKILLDIFNGDQTLCSRSDELEHSWELISRILKGWDMKRDSDLHKYHRREWGPLEAEQLIAKKGRTWL